MARQRAHEAMRAAREAGERHREAVAADREIDLGVNQAEQRRVATFNRVTGHYEIRNL